MNFSTTTEAIEAALALLPAECKLKHVESHRGGTKVEIDCYGSDTKRVWLMSFVEEALGTIDVTGRDDLVKEFKGAHWGSHDVAGKGARTMHLVWKTAKR